MSAPKLYMLLIGCKPKGRNTEQHDTLFAVGHSLKELVPQIKAFWRGASPLHLDAIRIVENVDGHAVRILPKTADQPASPLKLFFINLGGYKENEFDEFHYKMLVAANSKPEAVAQAKQTAFYKYYGYNNNAHIDDRYGIDVDDFFEIKDILLPADKMNYTVWVEKSDTALPADKIELGYFKLDEL